MNFKNKSVLVTGASGFIGSHVVQALLHEGANVRAFVHYNSMNTKGYLDQLTKDEQNGIEMYMGDLKDPHGVMNACKGVDTVLHLGALIAIPYSYVNPTDVVQTNVLGTVNIAQAVRHHGIARLVHTSTSETYGTAQYVPMDETHPLQGQSPYSASKIAADKMIESFYCSYELPAITVRPFNAYGPRQSMRAVIPTIINQALHEDEIRLGNLKATRDFTYVEDTARAFLHAASCPSVGEVINAGSGFEISIGELAEKIKKMVGRDIPITVKQDRLRPEKSEVDRLFSNSDKAQSMMGWKAQVSLDEGLSRTIEWMKQHKSLFRPDEYVV
ncbi:SDR family NAD(P)-dependent oxidoreductase [Caldalkalibacillus salinus]|uniref:SDR family NAD(P)-dependent oxidoreductase n=1 Tax=Caldalkalibacillus salinus TaxID=2803787 RepID=UPI001F21BA4B|nr:SDR family NAD(P)-dependent oxidoreductase [Caldalkalibacillus salinus]